MVESLVFTMGICFFALVLIKVIGDIEHKREQRKYGKRCS